MKNTIIVIFALGFLSFNSAFSQSAMMKQVRSDRPKSGDHGLDSSLTKIDKVAEADMVKFKQDLSTQYNIGLPKVDQMLVKMPPADAYMACEVSKQTGKPVDEVVKSYDKNKAKGWGEIAKEMGIKPGSPEFHALKNSAKGKSGKNDHHDGHGHNSGNHDEQNHDHGHGHDKGKGKGKK